MCHHDGTAGEPFDLCADGARCLGHRSKGPPVTYLRHDCANQCTGRGVKVGGEGQ